VSDVAQQQVPEGYKKTDVGMIPEEWATSTIGENTRWSSGGTPNRKRDDYWEGSIPWISGSTLKTLEVSTSDQFLTEEGVAAGSKMAPVDTTLLLVRGSALHKYIRVGLVISPVSFNQDVKSLMPIGSVLPKFLTFFIKGMESELLKLVSSAGNSAGVLDTELVKNFKFLKPGFSEQTAIANALSDVDTLITSLEKLITKKRAIKTAAMQQLLTGKKRLPPFDKTHTGYKQTELGEIPEDWEVKELGSVTIFIGSGKTNTKGFGEFPLYGSTGKIGTCKAPEYDGESILVARVGANAGRLNYVTGNYGVSDNTIIVKLGGGSDIDFYKYQLIKKNLNTLVFGSGQPLITGSQLKTILLPVPISEEQAEISGALSDMDKEIDALEKRLTKTKQLKQGMMQELLTGRTRLI